MTKENSSRFEYVRKILEHQQSVIRGMTNGMPQEVASKYEHDLNMAMAELDAADKEIDTWRLRAETVRERLAQVYEAHFPPQPLGAMPPEGIEIGMTAAEVKERLNGG